jgi:F-type H+-transporting ATPase subunit b
MNSIVLFAVTAATGENPLQEISRTFGFNGRHFIAQVISFCIVALLLKKFAYNPVLKVLEQRRQQIAQGLANAEKIKAELARTEASRQEVLNQANLQANKLIEEARAAAARVQEQETQKAIASAAAIISKAREASAQEHAKMLSDLRREVGRLVVQTTTQVTGKILTVDDQRRLAEETTKQIAA